MKLGTLELLRLLTTPCYTPASSLRTKRGSGLICTVSSPRAKLSLQPGFPAREREVRMGRDLVWMRQRFGDLQVAW